MSSREAIQKLMTIPAIATVFDLEKAVEVMPKTRAIILSVHESLGSDVNFDVEGVKKAFADAGLGDMKFILLNGLSVMAINNE